MYTLEEWTLRYKEFIYAHSMGIIFYFTLNKEYLYKLIIMKLYCVSQIITRNFNITHRFMFQTSLWLYYLIIENIKY